MRHIVRYGPPGAAHEYVPSAQAAREAIKRRWGTAVSVSECGQVYGADGSCLGYVGARPANSGGNAARTLLARVEMQVPKALHRQWKTAASECKLTLSDYLLSYLPTEKEEA